MFPPFRCHGRSLYDNAIQSLADTTFAPLVNIQTVHLGKNPLVCDCNLRWLSRWIASFQEDTSQEQEEEQLGVEKSDARCEAPKRVAGKRLAQLVEGKFKCRGAEEFRTKCVTMLFHVIIINVTNCGKHSNSNRSVLKELSNRYPPTL